MLKQLTLIIFLFFTHQLIAGPMQKVTKEDDLINYFIEGGFNGVLLVKKDNQTLLRKAIGFKSESKIRELVVQDKLQIGSNTKQFIAASILKLQEDELLSINDYIVKYLPKYKSWENIQIKDILNHTSGIVNYTDKKNFWTILETQPEISLDYIIDFASGYPLDFSPKSNWNYSNTGYIIAGKIIEIVSGINWDQYIKNNFLLPLDMLDTGYSLDFSSVSEVKPITQDSDFNFNLSWALSAGALYSTIDDLAKWASIYNESDLLSNESKKLMQSPFLNGYGLGLIISPYNKDVMISHGGRTPGFVSSFNFLKKDHLTVITLDNNDGQLSIANTLLSYYTSGAAQVLKIKKYTMGNQNLNEYTGSYSIGKFTFEVFLKEKGLYLRPNDGQPPYLLKPVDIDSFNILNISGEEFIRDPNGNITALKHYQNGHITTFSKDIKEKIISRTFKEFEFRNFQNNFLKQFTINNNIL